MIKTDKLLPGNTLLTISLTFLLLAVTSLIFVFQRFLAHFSSGYYFDWGTELSRNSLIFISMGFFSPFIKLASDYFPINKKNATRNVAFHFGFALIFAFLHLILTSNINLSVFSYEIDSFKISKKIFLNLLLLNRPLKEWERSL